MLSHCEFACFSTGDIKDRIPLPSSLLTCCYFRLSHNPTQTDSLTHTRTHAEALPPLHRLQHRINTWHGRLPRGRHLTALSSRPLHSRRSRTPLAVNAQRHFPRTRVPSPGLLQRSKCLRFICALISPPLPPTPVPFIPAAGARVPPAV